MQTWLVHMAHPLRLKREVGWRGLIALNLLIGGNIVAALAFPVLPVLVVLCIADLVTGDGALLASVWRPLHFISFLAALFAALVIPLYGLAKRKRLREAGILLRILPYWAGLSIAAWRALRQLIFDPTRWEKTEHGVSASRPAPGGLLRSSVSNLRPPVRAGA